LNARKAAAVIGILSALMLAAGIILYFVWEAGERQKIVAEYLPDSSQITEADIYVGGKRYIYNQDLVNILFMGVDKSEEVRIQNISGKAGQADNIMLISLNTEEQTARVIQISRDSMTDIDIYDAAGNYYMTINAQLALQYAYGLGGKSSCWAVKKTVRELLYDVPIDAYVSLNVGGIGAINDALGGVTVVMEDDYTDIDPHFTEGEKVHLDGVMAERYIRKRDINVDASNQDRMKRQSDYLSALSAVMGEKHRQGTLDYESIYQVAEPYMVTDISLELLKTLGEYRYLTDEIEYLPGEIRAGEQYEEYHIDDMQLQNDIVRWFYLPV